MPRLATAQQRGPGRVATSCIVARCNAASRVAAAHAAAMRAPCCNRHVAPEHADATAQCTTLALQCQLEQRGAARWAEAVHRRGCRTAQHAAAVENERVNAVHPQQYSMSIILQHRTCLPIGCRVFCADATRFGDRHCGHAVRGEAARLVGSATTESRAQAGDVREAVEKERSVRRLAEHF